MLKHSGSKIIETNRTIMRKFNLDDAEAMFNNWASDEVVTRYLTWQPHSDVNVSKNILKMWCEEYNSSKYHWALVLKEINEPIGSIGIVRMNEEEQSAEFGYAISRKYWNKGIVTEAMTALLDYFFNEVGFLKISALHAVDNPASGRVMQKLGMTYVGRISGELKNNKGNPVDVSKYEINKDEFNSLKIRKAYSHEVDLVAKLYDNLVSYMSKTNNYPGWKIGVYPTHDVAKRAFDEDALYVAVKGGKIAGTCVLNNNQPEQYKTARWEIDTDKPMVLHTLAISPDCFKQGIAQQLLQFTEDLAIKEGIHSIRFDTSESNIPAIKLYEKIGYKITGSVDLQLKRIDVKRWYTFEKIV